MPGTTKTREPQPTDAHIGARIRLRRKMMRMSQSELAGRIGVTFQQLQKYEKGVNRIGASRLVQICSVLDVTPAWMFENAHSDLTATAREHELDGVIAAFHADGMAPQLMLAWLRLPPGVKRSMVKLMTLITHQDEGT
jgi:transcriptional regulator with XRE-family HTH domain